LKKVTKEVIAEFISSREIVLAPTQERLCVPIIDRIFRKMSVGIRFADIKVRSNLVCDGHHRYIAALMADFRIGVAEGSTTSATIARDWRSVVLDTEDWDTEEKLIELNEQDARFNDMSIDDLVALLE
jgi:hypothetical protein